MSIPIRIASKSCHQPPKPSSFERMGAKRSDGLALIDWPMVAVVAAFALLFVVGLTMTAWLLEVHPGYASAGGAQTSKSSITLARVSEEQEEVLATVPASSTPNPPAPFPKREGGEEVKSESSSDRRLVLLPGPPSLPASFHKREEGKGIRSAPTNCRQTFGTSVEFVSRPALAARQARDAQKLLYVLHLSGNFENDRFT